MVDPVNPNLLSDTLNIVQLARQAALARGNQDKAGKLSSVADGLHKVASEAGQSSPAGQKKGTGFRHLVAAMQEDQTSPRTNVSASGLNSADMPGAASQAANSDRNQLVQAMASGSMTDVEIARQLGITRDEVRAILSLNRSNNSQGYAGTGGGK